MSDVDAPVGPPPLDIVAGWFDLHARPLATYASRRVGRDLAHDIVADTFRVACEQFTQYDARRGGERAWLFGIATNLIRRHWRTEERRLRNQTRATGLDPRPADSLLRVDDRLDALIRYERVVDAVATLAPEDRELLILIAWEHMTNREAADVLGIPAGTARSRLNQIRTHLAQTVNEGDTHG